jgi:predicted GNAT superfamily acetyltransferase/predicted GIY-YIG superfamily endonuclease
MSNSLSIRPLTEPDELDAVTSLEIDVWGLDPRDATPMSLMRPISLHGGVILGAFMDADLIGLSIALPLRHGSRWVLWSHVTAVHPDYQNKGIGLELKLAQREWALENGYSEIRWTFDPLQRGNAHFNLHILGATTDTFHVAYYGWMNDEINRDAVSDRVEASWKLKNPRTKALAQRKSARSNTRRLDLSNVVLAVGSDGLPLTNVPAPSAERLIAIPRHRHQITGSVLTAWQAGLRSALQDAFAAGYTATDFIDAEDAGYFLLEASPAWHLYVLKCADGSFYTGVTPDLAARLAKHQAGKAAAYTTTRRPVEMIGTWAYASRSDALKAEIAFKRLTRANKLSHVLRQSSFRGAAFQAPPRS